MAALASRCLQSTRQAADIGGIRTGRVSVRMLQPRVTF